MNHDRIKFTVEKQLFDCEICAGRHDYRVSCQEALLVEMLVSKFEITDREKLVKTIREWRKPPWT